MEKLLAIYTPANRAKLLAVSFLVITLIAVVDWRTKPYISLGFLYLFPIMIVGGYLTRLQTVVVALVCAVLQEAFSNLPPNEAVVRLVLSSAGFVGTGLFISELLRNRRIVLAHVTELEEEASLRREAQEQLRILVESSPASIVTIDLQGTILLANEAAQQLLAPEKERLEGQAISRYLPALQTILQTQPARMFRTALQCRGQRSSGEAFLAGIWFSTYTTLSGPRLAAIVVDLSEDLRNREDLSLDHLLKSARILMSAMAHEVRNLCGAVLVVHKNLTRVTGLSQNEDFQALSTLIQSLEKVAALELEPVPVQTAASVDLAFVLDELRILIGTAYRDSDIEVEWEIEDALPLVWADRYGLVQVFLNLAKNSQRALASSPTRRLRVAASDEGGNVVIRFEDTGGGVALPENLFRPFQRGADATGLGLYASRAILRSFGGDLLYESRANGCCFSVVLPVLVAHKGSVNA